MTVRTIFFLVSLILFLVFLGLIMASARSCRSVKGRLSLKRERESTRCAFVELCSRKHTPFINLFIRREVSEWVEVTGCSTGYRA